MVGASVARFVSWIETETAPSLMWLQRWNLGAGDEIGRGDLADSSWGVKGACASAVSRQRPSAFESRHTSIAYLDQATFQSAHSLRKWRSDQVTITISPATDADS